MSAECTLAFYGVRFEVANDEVTSLEERLHPVLVAARQNGLKSYWGNFGLEATRYVLFVGNKIGILGLENDRGVQLSFDELVKQATDTDTRLRRAGINERAMLYLEWQPDA